MAKQDDSLFLLEVLIDRVVFVQSPCLTDKDFRTCVNIECENVDPLEICDDDPGINFAKSDGPFVKSFNSGKSCLFSLKEADITKAMSKFPIKVTVYKALPCGCLPTKIIMGQATIDMTKEFVQARKKFLEDPTNVSYQALKDAFRIVGPTGVETGEILMFLRISCFGKLIITRFQGGGAPTLGNTSGSTITNRTCEPRREFQSSNDPCACGAARSGAGGGSGTKSPCPRARDPYNSMPCEDPDDPCFCTGPKACTAQKMLCRNTDKYCLHVPKGILLSLPFHQELTEKQKLDIKQSSSTMKQIHNDALLGVVDREQYTKSQPIIISEFLTVSIGNPLTPYYNQGKDFNILDQYSLTSLRTIKSLDHSVPSENLLNYKSINSSQRTIISNQRSSSSNEELFGEKETKVYMTLFNDFYHHRNSSTQATAAINKCLQVCCNSNSITNYAPSSLGMTANTSRATSSYLDYDRYYPRSSEVYFWGRKTNDNHSKLGMGSSVSKSSMKRSQQAPVAAVKSANTKAKETATIQTHSKNSSTGAQTWKAKGETASTCTTKAVSIKDEKPCPATNVTKGDMVATVSHIRIGPREPCPIYNKDPCQGPKCIIASTGDELSPVKVSTVTNPRRGVFELVIRRLTGAPLAKNELMLEWTPPPSRPQPCGIPCSIPCSFPSPCRSKCKIIACNPLACKLKCYKKVCKRSCRVPPCRPMPCRRYCKPFSARKPFITPCRPCSPCKPCSPKLNKPCSQSPCNPCHPKPCNPCPPRPCKPCSPRSCKPSPPPPCRRKLCPLSPCNFCGSCIPCTTRSSNADRPCGPSVLCKPCPGSICRACGSSCGTCPAPASSCCETCSQPYCVIPCYKPCKSSPCLRPCPVGRKRPRKARSQPRISAHRKRISPCSNRSRNCPVVRCRSMPGPCVACCGIPPCPLRQCCSTASPKCCKSECSICCG